MKIVWRVLGALCLSALLLGFSEAQAASPEAIGMHLENAGFTMRAAVTPEQVARLRKLPPRKFIARTKAGVRYFIYADPDYCRCVFVGGQRAMRNYRDIAAAPLWQPGDVPASGVTVADEMIQDMDAEIGDVPDGDIFDIDLSVGE